MLSAKRIKLIGSSKNAVLITLTVIGAIAIYNRIVAPHANYLWAVQRYESIAGHLARKNQVINNNVKIKRKELEEIQAKFEHIRIKLFDPVKAREFFSDIQALSEQTNCTIYSLSFPPTDGALEADKSKASSQITENRATLSVMGGYRNIVSLINKLQDRPKQVWIDSVSIKPLSNRSDELKCDITITIRVIHNEESDTHD